MAYEFVSGNSDRLNNDSADALVEGLSNLTISYWVTRLTATRQTANFIRGSGSRFGADAYTDNVLYFFTDSSNYGTISLSPTSGTMHLGGTFDGAASGNSNRLKIYQNGIRGSETYTGTIGSSVPADVREWSIGESDGVSYGAGTISEVAIWDASLTAAEMASLAKGFKAHRIRPQNLLIYVPLVRSLNDVVAGLVHTNPSGTLPTAHPRVY